MLTINVAKRDTTRLEPCYLHAFRVHVPETATEADAREVFAQISQAFPAPQYNVRLSAYDRWAGFRIDSNEGVEQ